MSNNWEDIEVQANKGGGIYLFCFARPHVPPVLKVSGLEDRYAVSQWAFKDIVAVLSKVTLEEFCGPSAESRMNDLSWVGPRACRHEKVVEEIMCHSPVLPARFGTIFFSLKSLENLLKMHHTTISQFLDQVAEKEEWSVKGVIDRGKAKEELFSATLAEEARHLASLAPGMRYFQEKRIQSSVGEKLNLWLKEVCGGIANDLGDYASDFCERKVLSRDATGTDGDMVLNWAFLVPQNAREDFGERVVRLNASHAQSGLVLELSGPWPPYSFCPSLEME